ncbi:MAG: BatD family protein, partial [Myxococcales bacterium]|nr:BatD family protein [Myxococcales bacterium]
MRSVWMSLHRLLGLVIGLIALLVACPAAAQTRVQAGVSAEVVELGEGFYVELKAEVEGNGSAGNPNLILPPSFTTSGPSTSSTGMSFSFGRGPTSMRRIFSAQWFVIANALGTFDLAPPTVTVNGEVVAATGKLHIKVVAAGQGPRKKPQRRSGAFGGFGNFFGPSFPSLPNDPFFDEPDVDEEEDDAALDREGEELALDSGPLDPVVLHIKADREKAWVGEQVTLSYWVYFRDGSPRNVEVIHPPLTDFLRQELDHPPERRVRTRIGQVRYHAALVDRLAVFPLRAGKLETGQGKGRFMSLRGRSRVEEKLSNSVTIEVHEPPKEGRPVGYHVGDVGRSLKLSAEVTPRSATVGDTVVVMVRLTGYGALPSELRVPERAGVEWLEPEKKVEVGPRGGTIGGFRTFNYAVRLREAGDIDLGTIELPYWDARAERYVTVQQALGSVSVTPAAGGAAPVASASPEVGETPLAKIGGPRATPAAFVSARRNGFDPLMLWSLVLIPPMGVGLCQVGTRAGGAYRRRRRERADDPRSLARAALDEAASA